MTTPEYFLEGYARGVDKAKWQLHFPSTEPQLIFYSLKVSAHSKPN